MGDNFKSNANSTGRTARYPPTTKKMTSCTKRIKKAGNIHLLKAFRRYGEVPHVTKSKNGHDSPARHQRLNFLAHCQFHVLLHNRGPRLPKPYLRAVQILATAYMPAVQILATAWYKLMATDLQHEAELNQCIHDESGFARCVLDAFSMFNLCKIEDSGA